jgi:hypothetical protein
MDRFGQVEALWGNLRILLIGHLMYRRGDHDRGIAYALLKPWHRDQPGILKDPEDQQCLHYQLQRRVGTTESLQNCNAEPQRAEAREGTQQR